MIILNSIHFIPYEFGLDFFGLVLFGLFSFLFVTILLFYYSLIPKKDNSILNELNSPIFESKDFFLQINESKSNVTIEKNHLSIFIKILIFLLIILVILIPFDQLLKFTGFF